MANRVLAAWKRSAHTGPASLEIFMAFFAALWAVLLLSPSMQATNVSRVLREVMPSPGWSFLLTLLAACQIAALARGYKARRRMAWVGVFAWGCLAGALFAFAVADSHLSPIAAFTASVQFLSMVVGYILIALSLSLVWTGG